MNRHEDDIVKVRNDYRFDWQKAENEKDEIRKEFDDYKKEMSKKEQWYLKYAKGSRKNGEYNFEYLHQVDAE